MRNYLKETMCLVYLVLSMIVSASAIEVYPLHDPFISTVNSPHLARLLDNDTAALENILEMIDRAQRSIEMEYFVFNPDKSGRLVLQALIRKAVKGVKVRILVDYCANGLKPGLDAFYHSELEQHGIHLRYFNVGELWKFWEVGFRNHRKLLVIDDEELLAGGRNIADAYFGMSDRMDYLDRDIWIKGPIAQIATQGFDLFWDNPIVTNPENVEKPLFQRRANLASSKGAISLVQDKADYQSRLDIFNSRTSTTKDSLYPRAPDIELRRQVARVGGLELAKSPILTVHSITLASDAPIPGEPGRVVTPYLCEKIKNAKKNLLIENFIFMVKGQEKRSILHLLDRGVKIDLLTNGFNSEPNPIMAELANSRQNMAVHHGMNVFCYCGPPDSDRLFSGKSSIWGLHTKTMVIDGKDSVISSFNLDPRSRSINDEGAVVINDNPDFAKLLEEKTLMRINYAAQMYPDGSYSNGYHCNSIGRIITIILRPLAELISDQL